MREWCDDLAALLDAAGSKRAVIAGHCLGANIALNFCARYPQRTSGLALIEPMPPKALAGSLRRLAWFRFLLFFAANIVRILNRAGIRRRRLEPLDLEQWDKAVRSDTADLERYASPFSDLRMTPVAAFLQGLAAIGDPLPDLSAIRCPTLVLVSSKSTMTDPARTRAIMQAIPGVEIVQLDAEHWIPTEQPEAMCRAIEDWIARKGLEKAA
jgi:esterase